MDAHQLIDRVINAIVVASAVTLAGAVAHREFSQPPAQLAASTPTYHANWREVSTAGRWTGARDAPVVLIEFGDFECPFCKKFEKLLGSLRMKHGSRLATVYVHYPLSNHRFALPAARAAECAADQGRFDEFRDALFAKQDSLGMKRWESYANEAGVRDTITFGVCAASTDTLALIRAGVTAGKRVGIRGTPAVMINGWLYSGGLDSTELDQAVAKALAESPLR